MSEEVKREVQTWDPVEWLDRIINGEQTYTLQEVPGNSGHYKLVPDNVEVIQKGTPLSQSRLNRMTDGISFSHNVIGAIAAEALRQAGLAHKNRQVDFEKRFAWGIFFYYLSVRPGTYSGRYRTYTNKYATL